MRIGIICPYNYFRPGGVQMCVQSIAAELKNRGHYVRVIVPRPRVVPDDIDDNIIMLGGSTEFNTPFATKADLSLSISNERIDALFESEKFDVLHFHEPGVPVFGAQLIGRSKTANVGTMHATLPENLFTKSFEKLMTPYAKYIEPRLHAVTAVSVVAKNTALTYAPNAEIDIVPNGINIAVYKKTKIDTGNKSLKTIVYIGRLEKRKGVRYLLDAFAQLRREHDGIELIIAGDGRLKTGLQARVKKYDIPDVSFVGFVSDAEKIRLLQTANVYSTPALYGESFGIVLLEAMAASCVVVAGNNPGYASVMTGRGRLSLVNSESTSDFAHRLEMMLYDEDLRAMWLEWAQQDIKQYEYSNIVDQYEVVYAKAIKIHKKSNA